MENFMKTQNLNSLVEKEKSSKNLILKNKENETVDPVVSTWKSGKEESISSESSSKIQPLLLGYMSMSIRVFLFSF